MKNYGMISAFLLMFIVAMMPELVAAYTVKLQEPIAGVSSVSGGNGFDLIKKYISLIYRFFASLIGITAVLMIVFAGTQIIFGGAEQGLVQDAKERIRNAILSLILLFGTALLLKTVNPQFFN